MIYTVHATFLFEWVVESVSLTEYDDLSLKTIDALNKIKEIRNCSSLFGFSGDGTSFLCCHHIQRGSPSHRDGA